MPLYCLRRFLSLMPITLMPPFMILCLFSITFDIAAFLLITPLRHAALLLFRRLPMIRHATCHIAEELLRYYVFFFRRFAERHALIFFFAGVVTAALILFACFAPMFIHCRCRRLRRLRTCYLCCLRVCC